MADIQYPAAPQEFTFQGRSLAGVLVSFNGSQRRRSVSHRFLKRRGGKVEDMEQAQRTLSVRLHFIKSPEIPNVAKAYNDFKASVADNPRGLLNHPIAGRWQAFCEGPDENVDFDRAITEIQVLCNFIEDELDAQTPREVPDVATAAQDTTAQETVMEQAIAVCLGEIAKAQTFGAQALAKIDAAIALVTEATSPIDEMSASIRAAVGASARIVGQLSAIQAKGHALAQNVESYVAAATDLFNGGDQPSAQADATSTLLGIVVTSAQALADAIVAAAVTPAGAAEAVGNIEETASACYVLSEALLAARPPTITVITKELIDLITFCVKQYPKDPNPIARAFDIMGLNRIPNPAAIPAGTSLQVPSR